MTMLKQMYQFQPHQHEEMLLNPTLQNVCLLLQYILLQQQLHSQQTCYHLDQFLLN